MTIANPELCECGKPASERIKIAYARVLTLKPACERCAEKWGLRVPIEGRKPSEICDDLDEILKVEKMREEGIYCGARWTAAEDKPITRYRWVTVFPVTGTNEGHYIHIEVHLGYQGGSEGKTIAIGLLKTFNGWDRAWEVAKRIAFLLQA